MPVFQLKRWDTMVITWMTFHFRFAAQVVSEGQCLDVLINNAGCMTDPRTVTSDGLEANFATNTLGAHILTESLIPALSKSSDARVR